jgi:dephospho-CoA kinase
MVVALVASEETRRERLQAREQAAGRAPLSSSALDDRLTAQLSSEEKARRADFVLRTDGSLAETEAQVRVFWRERIEGGLDEAGNIAVV